MAEVALGLSVLTAAAQVKAGKQAQLAYKMQAEQAKLEGRQRAIQYKQKGVEQLRELSKMIATTNARAAAGNIDPFSGSPQAVKAVSTEAGFTDALFLRENAQLVELGAVQQAAQFEMAGKQARLQGYIGATSTLVNAGTQYAKTK